MRLFRFFILFIAFLFHANELFATEKQPFVIGEKVSLHSKILNEDRLLNIYLPNNYSPDSAETYPVIYLLDGSIDEDIIHIAGLVQFASFSWINMIPPCIVVGIANIDRKRDFTYPTSIEKDQEDFPTTGGSEKFIDFIETELQPFIAENYKTNDDKTIIGQSLGGLLAAEILIKKPRLFEHYVIVSPSIWWDNESLLTQPVRGDLKGIEVYISVGNEGKIMIGGAKKFHKKMKKLFPKKAPITFEYFKAQNHGDALHLSVYSAFNYLNIKN